MSELTKKKRPTCNGCKKEVGDSGGCVTVGCEGTAYWGNSDDNAYSVPGRLNWRTNARSN